MNVAEPSNVKSLTKLSMAPPFCEKIREMPHKDQRETITHIEDQITTNPDHNQQPCKTTLILLLPASRHDKHDTHIKMKHTTHPAPGDISTTTHHSSRSMQHCRSDVITTSPSPFLHRHDRRCSSLEVCNTICCCGLGSCCTFLPALHPSFYTYHLPTNITTPSLTVLYLWLWFFYRESFPTTHRKCERSRRTRCLR